MTFENQSTQYLQYIHEYALPVVYVASGNESSISTFAKATFPTPVVTKASLLAGKDLALLQSLSWDVQGEVDHLVLLRCSRFLGMTDSSFSWAVAVARRANTSTDGTCDTWRKGVAEVAPEEGLALKDNFSVIIGPPSRLHLVSRIWP